MTREFRETVKDRADRDPEFCKGLLAEAMNVIVRGEREVADIILRDYIDTWRRYYHRHEVLCPFPPQD
jgi:hypothetical protein